MSVPGVRRLRRAGGKIKKYFSPRALILLYHRIGEAGSDPWQLAVTPQHFAEHLQVLRRFGRPLPLGKLSAALRHGGLPRRTVLVTFDDGYADNLLQAKPLLEKYDIPASVFITTEYTGADREFWWDDLDRLFLQPGVLPGALGLRVKGRDYHWQLGETARYDETACDRHLGWRAWQADEPTPRHAVYRSLWQLMQIMPDSEQQQVRRELLAWAGAGDRARPTHRALTPTEIVELARGGLVDVGCHTLTHPQLSALSPDAQRREIRLSKAQLEEVLGRAVTSFAYPYGRACDYTPETVALVQEAGFDCACSTLVGSVGRRADRFQLPRLQVHDMDGDAFARLLSEHL